MLINKDNYDDIVKYYLKTFVKFKEEGDVIYYIKQVSHTDVICENIKGEEIAIDLSLGYTLDYLIPKKTVYQHGEFALFLSRVPARMWRKGMDNRNTQFETLTSQGLWGAVPFSISVIDGFINKPSYYSFEDAITNFEKGEHLQSAALTPRISMTRRGGIFVDKVMVGKYAAKTIAVKNIFLPEITKIAPKNVKIKGV